MKSVIFVQMKPEMVKNAVACSKKQITRAISGDSFILILNLYRRLLVSGISSSKDARSKQNIRAHFNNTALGTSINKHKRHSSNVLGLISDVLRTSGRRTEMNVYMLVLHVKTNSTAKTGTLATKHGIWKNKYRTPSGVFIIATEST